MAWLSFEESDGRPASFWTYVLATLQRVMPGVGASVLPLLQAAQPPIEAVLATVLNELITVPNDIHLVLDDYHLVDGPALLLAVTIATLFGFEQFSPCPPSPRHRWPRGSCRLACTWSSRA